MTRTRSRWLAALLGSLATSILGCDFPKEAGFPQVSDQVAERTGYRPHWYRGAVEEQAIRDEVARLLAQPLDMRSSIKLALVNDRRIQGDLEELGIARADLVQASLLANPSIGGSLRFAHGKPNPNIEGDFGLNLLSLITLPARKRAARAGFEQMQLSVADHVLGRITEVRKAFVELQADQQRYALDLAIAQAAQASFDSAVALHKAGNVSDLRLAEEQALYERARLSLLASQGAVSASRERLNRLLGLWGGQTAWTVSEELAAVPASDPPLADLEKLAIEQRLDLAAAKKHTEAIAQELGLAQDWGWLYHAELGASLERDFDGTFSAGPSASVELPVFDGGQARVERLGYMLRRSYHEVSALAVDIRSDVRLLREQMVMHRRRAEHYRDVVIPLRERIVRLTMEQYNFMLVGVFELLQKKQDESQAYRDYIDAIRDYWVTRAELARAVGGRFPS